MDYVFLSSVVAFLAIGTLLIWGHSRAGTVALCLVVAAAVWYRRNEDAEFWHEVIFTFPFVAFGSWIVVILMKAALGPAPKGTDSQ